MSKMSRENKIKQLKLLADVNESSFLTIHTWEISYAMFA